MFIRVVISSLLFVECRDSIMASGARPQPENMPMHRIARRVPESLRVSRSAGGDAEVTNARLWSAPRVRNVHHPGGLSGPVGSRTRGAERAPRLRHRHFSGPPVP